MRASWGVEHYLVEENLILFFHTRHECILRQGILSTAVLLVGPLYLLVQCLDIGR